MRSCILAAIAALTIGIGVANAAPTQYGQAQQSQHTQTHRPNYYNYMQGGGG